MNSNPPLSSSSTQRWLSPSLTSLLLLLSMIACREDASSSDSDNGGEEMTSMDLEVTPPTGGQGEDMAVGESPEDDMMVENIVDMEPPELDLEPPPLRDLTLNSIVPNRGAIGGGDEVQIIGTGFTPTTQFTFDVLSCREVRVESSTRARCLTPEGQQTEEPIDVTAYDERVEMGSVVPYQALLEEGYSYFVPLSVDQVLPERGPTSGNTRVTLVGVGFSEGTVVNFGQQRSLQVTFEANGTLSVLAPPSTVGAVDISVRSPNGEAVVPEGYYYYERLRVDRVDPPIGPLNGGIRVTLHGEGLLEMSRINFGERPTEVQSVAEDGSTLDVIVPPGDAVGPIDIDILNLNGALILEEAFVYYDAAAVEFQAHSAVPNRGPIQGGQELYIVGAGFTEEATVDIGGRIATCDLIDSFSLRCTTPPNVAGAVRLTVNQGAQSAEVSGGYTYFQEIELLSIFPDRGSISGGTLVELNGRGFTPEMVVTLGEQPLVDLEVVDELFARGYTSPYQVSTVDVIASTEYAEGVIDNGYQYYDPTSQFGGVWGEDLEITMNITVINGGTGDPLPEVQLLLITADLLTLEEITDAEGRATMAHPELRGPANITAAKEGFEVTTLEDVDVENITIILTPQPEGSGAPPPGVPLATLRGSVRGLDLLPKPNNERYVNLVVVETTHTQPSNRVELPPPGPGGILYEDGPFEILSRLGELAVIATAGRIERITLDSYLNGDVDYWTMRAEIEAQIMGVRRFVSARSGEITDGLFIELDHPLDFQIPVDLDNPPYDINSGLSYFASIPRLNFGAEGFWEIGETAVELTPNLTLTDLPRLDGWGDDVLYFLINFAFTNSADNTPLSINIEETRDVEAGVFVTPFSPAALFENPLPNGELDEDRILSWRLSEGYDGPMPTPSATVVAISAPSLGPPIPLWRYVVPPGVTEVTMPILSPNAGETGLNGGFMFLDINPFLAEGRFDYSDFTYFDINGLRWKSWGISSTSFNE